MTIRSNVSGTIKSAAHPDINSGGVRRRRVLNKWSPDVVSGIGPPEPRTPKAEVRKKSESRTPKTARLLSQPWWRGNAIPKWPFESAQQFHRCHTAAVSAGSVRNSVFFRISVFGFRIFSRCCRTDWKCRGTQSLRRQLHGLDPAEAGISMAMLRDADAGAN